MTKKETNKKPAVKKGKPGRKPKAKVEKSVIEETVSEEAKAVNNVEEPTQSEPKEETIIEVEFDIANGDPSVVIPANKNNGKEEVLRETTSLVPEKIYTEMQPEEYEASELSKKKNENKPKPNIIKRIIGYFWNGQEMDY
jgi:hypothetical protein